MSTERWQQLDRIFIEAVQRPADERSAFIDDACGTDAALRTDLLALLAAVDDSSDFMATSAFEFLAKTVAAGGWRLEVGERVGAYVVLNRLGAGASGEVWRARDERLGRDVAIKVVLPHATSDAERLRRFAEEARLAGSLNHANVLTVYDVGEHAGLPMLVTECLEGQSLRRRLGAGPVPVGKAINVALGLARGLAAAHARGVVHRDVKPENVFLRTEGDVKILDFGLAKLLPSLGGDVAAQPPAIDGVVLGTPGYMAPEQVRGGPVDARADLFAVGVITCEMLTGINPFKRASVLETLHATLTADVPDLAAAGRGISPAIARIVLRLLEKSPEARFQSAQDLAWALEQLADGSSLDQTRYRGAPATRARWRGWAAAGVVLAAGLSGAAVYSTRAVSSGEADPIRLTQFTWALPEGLVLDSAPVVSPDGHRIVFAARTDAAPNRLFVRELAALEPVVVVGTEGARQPFWSPDSTSVGFFARGKLITMAVDGGAPVTIADAPDPRGGTWSSSGVIVFQSHHLDMGLSQVPAAGGATRPATVLDITGPDTTHRWPAFLPDGIHFVYQVISTVDERRGVYLGSVVAPAAPAAPLFRSSSGAVFVSLPDRDSGLLLSAEDGWIEARTFDAAERRVVGDALRIDIASQITTPQYPALLSASADLLTFASSEIPNGMHIATASRTGGDLVIWPERNIGGFLRVSPEGGRLARTLLDPLRANNDIWHYDLDRGTRVRVSTSRDHDVSPAWSPDGSRIAYRSGTNTAPTLKISSADGVGPVQTLACPRPYCEPTDWSPDGFLVVNVSEGDVWAVPFDSSTPPRPLLNESFLERDARISPSGRWLAFVSDESGRPVVSVRSMSEPLRRYVVSMSGGDQPVWRRDGKELFYVDAKRFLQRVPVSATADGGLSFGAAQAVKIPRFAERHWGTVYDVSPDGMRVYFPHPATAQAPSELGVVLGWRALLQR
jgi:Tol biopolymer transport system component